METSTVKVKGEGGDYIVINEADFDVIKHEIWSEKPPKNPTKTPKDPE